MGAGLFRGFRGFTENNELLLILLFIAVFSTGFGGGRGGDCYSDCEEVNNDDSLIFYIILLFLFTFVLGMNKQDRFCPPEE